MVCEHRGPARCPEEGVHCGIPSEVLPDVTRDVRAEVTQAGGRSLADEASQKRVKAIDICLCGAQSEKARQ
ncbi:Hypothetical protein SMAX5B_002086 [Scophthalmus maximus]|uniref:Uncharacterized protein n=1 Tax=Scophthalmus maximus TaxID=52904 RepID=A0A2U9CWG6_SCOMX|nr:Hypothetical protein SMAX5B_002086 [Scophthalmus maximus]